MKYSNITNTNVVNKEDSKLQISNTLDNIATIVGNSLGPYGSTTIIESRFGEHTITKDGYTILNAINYYFDIPKTVLGMIKDISRTLVKTVGDGSTSSVVIANYLYKEINKILDSDEWNIAPQDIINILNEVSIILKDEIIKSSIEITDDNFEDALIKIAGIATNNNFNTGKLLCDIFKDIGRFGCINIEIDNRKKEDYYKRTNGIEIKTGWINQRMTTEDDKITFKYEDCKIFMCNDILDDDDMDLLALLTQNICINQNKPLMIIAPKYSLSIKSFFDANLQKNKHLPLIAIELEYNNDYKRNLFEDLALLLNCDIYNKFDSEEDPSNFRKFNLSRLGSCKSISGNDIRTVFIDGHGLTANKEKINERIEKVKEEINELKSGNKETNDFDISLFRLETRIANLSNSMATLYICSNSNLESQTKKYLIEDAIYACKSALEYGYIIGGNLIVPKLLNLKKDYYTKLLLNNSKLSYLSEYDGAKEFYILILDKIEEAFLSSFEMVLRNANLSDAKVESILHECSSNMTSIYNLKKRKYENIKDTTIVNSAQTDIEIINACFSIIGLLATSNQFIATNPVSNNE